MEKPLLGSNPYSDLIEGFMLLHRAEAQAPKGGKPPQVISVNTEPVVPASSPAAFALLA